MGLKKGDELSFGLIKRAYLIAFILFLIVLWLIFFIFNIQIDKIKSGLKSVNLYYISKISNSFNHIYHDLSILKVYDLSDFKSQEVIGRNKYIKSVYIFDKKLSVFDFFGEEIKNLDELLLLNNEPLNSDIMVSKFISNQNSTIILAKISADNERNIIAAIDILGIFNELNQTMLGKRTFFVDSSGFMEPLGNGDNIYDILKLNGDLKRAKNYGVSLGENFFYIDFDEKLNIGVVSIKPFWEIFSDNKIFLSVMFLIFVVVGLIILDNILFIKTAFINQIRGLRGLLDALKIGDTNTQGHFGGAFREIKDSITKSYMAELVARHDLRDFRTQYSLFFKHSNIIILFIDAKTAQINDASAAAVEFYGYSLQNLLSMRLYDLQVCDAFKHARVQVSSLYENQNTVLCTHKLANGELRRVQISQIPVVTELNSFYFMIISDITTSQSKLENLLKEKSLLSLSPVLIISLANDDAWSILQVSNNVKSVLGYSVDKMLFSNFSFKKIIHEGDIAMLRRDIDYKIRQFNSNNTQESEFQRPCRVRLESGKYEWFKFYIKITKDSENATCVTIFMFKNSTQKMIEDMLVERIAKYEMLFWTTGAMSFEYNPKNKLYRFSTSFFTILGYKQQELEPLDFDRVSKIIYKDDIIKFSNTQNRCLNHQENFRIEIRFISSDKKIVWMELKGKNCNLPNSKLICGTIEDISHKVAQRSQLKIMANVFSYSKEGIMVTDAFLNLIDVNDAFSAITGYEKDEILGKNPSILSSKKHDAKFYAQMWSDIEKDGFWSGEVINKRKNGENFAEILTIIAVKDENLKTQNYVGIFSPIRVAILGESFE